MTKNKANGKKMKFLKIRAKIERDEDSDGSISSDDVEGIEDNIVGMLLNNDYIIIRYIGRGTFSRVWLVYHFPTKEKRIAKIFFQDGQDEFYSELKIYNKLKDNKEILEYNTQLIDSFKTELKNYDAKSKNNMFNVLILPYLGMSINDLLDRISSEFISLEDSKIILKNILIPLNELHKLSILHTDLKDDNILTNIHTKTISEFNNWFDNLNIDQKYENIYNQNTPNNLHLLDKNKRKMVKRKIKNKTLKSVSVYLNQIVNKYQNCHNSDDSDDSYEFNFKDMSYHIIDFSNSVLASDIYEDDEFQIRPFRSPENIMGYTYNVYSEIWSVGCLYWFILTNNNLFEPELTGDYLKRDREQMAHFEKYLGKISIDLKDEAPRTYELFEDNGKIKGHKKINKSSLENKLREIRTDLNDEEINSICSFLRKIWNYNSKKRPKVLELLDDSFLIDTQQSNFRIN